MKQIKIDPIVGSIGTIIHRALDNQKIQHEFGALNEKAVIIGLKYDSLSKLSLEQVDLSKVKYKVKDGILFVIYEDKVTQEELNEVNNKILKKLAELGIDSHGYVTNDGEAIITVNLNDVSLKILDSAIERAKAKLGNKMRLIRVKFANDDTWGYMVIYKKGTHHKEEVKPDDLSELAI